MNHRETYLEPSGRIAQTNGNHHIIRSRRATRRSLLALAGAAGGGGQEGTKEGQVTEGWTTQENRKTGLWTIVSTCGYTIKGLGKGNKPLTFPDKCSAIDRINNLGLVLVKEEA